MKEKDMNFIKINPIELGSSMEVNKLRKVEFKNLIESFEKRKLDRSMLDQFLEKDKKWREAIDKLNKIRAEKNKVSIQMSKEKDQKILEQLRKEAKELDKKEAELQQIEGELSEQRRNILLQLPNLLLENVPEEEGRVLAFFGEPKVSQENVEEFQKAYPNLKYKASKRVMSQYDIIKYYDLANEEKGVELAGARFYFALNEMVILNAALTLYGIKKLFEQGFRLITPPYMVRRIVEEGATTLDAFAESLYKIEGEDLYLIPTSEHPIAAINKEALFAEKELPILYGGFSAAFRKEAGAHGKDTKGIYRNHHFDKVEQFALVTPEQAEKVFNKLVSNQVEILTSLNIPVRVLLLPAWDMDKKAMVQVDVEGWWPAQNKFNELGSHGYMGSWQAARFNIKYTPKTSNKMEYVHTIYGTLVANQRTMACMLENNLDEDGVIHVPKVLADMTGIDEIKPKKQ